MTRKSKRLRAFGHGAGDMTKRDQAEGLSVQPGHLQQRRPSFAPLPFAHHPILLDRAAKAGQQAASSRDPRLPR
jgi:hypothetical protein